MPIYEFPVYFLPQNVSKTSITGIIRKVKNIRLNLILKLLYINLHSTPELVNFFLVINNYYKVMIVG